MKLRPQWIYAICFIIFTAFISWRFYDTNYKKKNQEVFFQLQNQLTGVSDGVALELNSYLQKAIQLSERLESNKSGFIPESEEVDYLLSFNSYDAKSVQPRWKKAKETMNHLFDLKFDTFLQKTLSQNLYRENRLLSIHPSAEDTYFVLVFPVQVSQVGKNELSYLAAVLPLNAFKKMIDRQRGGFGDLLIVNDQGKVIGHAINEYVGKSLKQEPIVAEITKGVSFSKKGFYKNARGQIIFGIYEKIQGTNVYAVSTISQSRVSGTQMSLILQIVFLGAGLLLAGFVLISIFYQQKQENINQLQLKLKSLTGKSSQDVWQTSVAKTQPVQKIQVSKDLIPENSEEKIKHYQQIAYSVSEMIRAPLTSILGNAQLAKARTTSLEVSEYCSNVEKEARQAREMLQQLMTFAGAQKVEKKKQNFAKFLDNTIKNLESALVKKNIKLKKEIQGDVELNFNEHEMEQAIKNIIQNSMDAMERSLTKDLAVVLKTTATDVEFKIKDTGEGIEAENITKIFNPFYTTKSHFHHVGLGMSAALGILKEHNGDIKVVSEFGKGTIVTMTLPIESIPQVDIAPKVYNESKEQKHEIKNLDFKNQPQPSSRIEMDETDVKTMVISNVDMPPDDLVLKENRFFKRKIRVRKPGEKVDLGSHGI